MRRPTLLLLSLLIAATTAFAGVNKKLNEAQRLFNQATTIEQFQNVKKRFLAAKTDVGYVAAEHDTAINEGIKKCDRKIAELSPNLSLSTNSLSFSADGGSYTISVTTNQSSFSVNGLPSWMSVNSKGSSSVSLYCSANPSTSSRSYSFTINAGGLSRTVSVSQRGKQQAVNNNNNAKLKVTRLDFANQANGKVLNSYGDPFYNDETRRFAARILYDGPSTETTKTVYVKIFEPDGTLETFSGSPSGYTMSDEITFRPGTGNYAYLPAYGNDEVSTFPVGTLRYEVWIDGSCVNTSYITINPGAPGALLVDGQSSLILNFDADGGTRTLSVSGAGSDWSTWGIPSFCSVNKGSTTFTLTCEANTSRDSRSDYMKIKAGDREVRIDIKQEGARSNITAKIEKVWMEHDVWENGEKGMRIHVKFDNKNMKGHTGRVIAYFYWDDTNGNPLKDRDNRYHTTDGNVCVGEGFTPSYDNSTYNDFKLFMPLDQFDITTSGKHSIKFFVAIRDNTIGEQLTDSDWQYITYTKN